MKREYRKQIMRLCRCDKTYRYLLLFAAALPLVLAAAAIVAWVLRDWLAVSMPACPIRRLTGFNCVSCGCTRATLSMLNGDFVTAFYFNPLYFVVIFQMIYMYVRLSVSLFVMPYKLYNPKINRTQMIITIAFIVGFTVIRNTPFYQTVFF